MTTLEFELRLMQMQTVMMPPEFYCRFTIEVRCREWPLVTGRLFCGQVDGGRGGFEAAIESIGWFQLHHDRWIYSITLPISAHELLEKSQGPLSLYFSREELLDLFNTANAQCSA